MPSVLLHICALRYIFIALAPKAPNTADATAITIFKILSQAVFFMLITLCFNESILEDFHQVLLRCRNFHHRHYPDLLHHRQNHSHRSTSQIQRPATMYG